MEILVTELPLSRLPERDFRGWPDNAGSLNLFRLPGTRWFAITMNIVSTYSCEKAIHMDSLEFLMCTE